MKTFKQLFKEARQSPEYWKELAKCLQGTIKERDKDMNFLDYIIPKTVPRWYIAIHSHFGAMIIIWLYFNFPQIIPLMMISYMIATIYYALIK